MKCVCCEKCGDDGVVFAKGLILGPVSETMICIDCITLGARYIVSLAKTALEKENDTCDDN